MAFFRKNRTSGFGASRSAGGQYDVSDYISQILQAFENEDGSYFSNLLSLTDQHGDYLLDSPLCQVEDGGASPEPWDLSALEDSVSTEYMGLVAAHLKCIQCIARSDLSSALTSQEDLSRLVAIMLPKIQNEDVMWFLPTVTIVARDLSSLALKADQQQNRVTTAQEGQIDRAFNSIQQIGSSSKAPVKEQGDDGGNSQQTIIRQASQPKGGQLPLRTPASNGSVTSVTAPVVSEKTSVVAGTTKMPLSTMQRFISNRGKLPGIVPSRISTTKLSQESSMTSLNDDKGVYVDYTAVRRPASRTQQEMPKNDQDDELVSAVKKIYRSAKSKIFDELQEMQRREEELRQTRQDLGLPDLSLEMGKENEQEPARSAEPMSRPQDIIVQEIAQIPVGRQSALLAQWEARITSAQAD